MSDESQAPASDEERDTPFDESTPEAPEAVVETPEDKPSEPEQIDPFDERFDPATLDDALLPAYKQLRADYTRKTQALAEERRQIEEQSQLLDMLSSDDPEEQAAALDALGYEIPDDSPDWDEDDEDYSEYDGADEDNELAALRAELDEVRQRLASEDEEAEAAEFEEQMNSYLDERYEELKKRTGRDFDDEEFEALEALAFAFRDENDLPSYENAYERIYGTVLPKERSRWVQSKDTEQPVSRGGSSATQVPDLDTEKGRHEYAAERARQIMAAEAGHTGT